MLEMSTNDVLALVGILVTLFFSVIAVWQSYSANEKAKEANGIAKKTEEISGNAFREQEKGSMPLIRLVGEIKACEKSIGTILNQVTFDLENMINDFDTGEWACLEVELENAGDGVVTGVQISKFIIFEGNMEIFDRTDENDSTNLLCYLEKGSDFELKNGLFEFLILPKERVKVNFVFNKSFDEMKEFINNNISVLMDLTITSVNDTEYNQENLLSVFVDKKVTYNSIGKVASCNEAKRK